jgi:acyl-homoserine lactone synthase
MIHVITPQLRRYYKRQLLEMHRLRAEIFVRQRGWRALTVAADGGEYDTYDDEQAVYLMSLMPDGGVGACQRLRPAADRSLLGDLFPHLLGPGAAAVGPDVCEGSRHVLSRACRAAGDLLPVRRLTVATMETAAALGASRMVAVVDVFAMQRMLSLGWPVRWIGLPAAYEEGECIACEVETTADAVARVRDRLGFGPDEPVVFDPVGDPLAAAEVEAVRRAGWKMSRASQAHFARIMAAVAHVDATQGEAAAEAFLDSVEHRLRGGPLA